MHWYNTVHHHSGLNFLTPYQRHNGHSNDVFQTRKLVYEAAKSRNPERWARDTRNWTLPNQVWLNPEKLSVIESETLVISE